VRERESMSVYERGKRKERKREREEERKME